MPRMIALFTKDFINHPPHINLHCCDKVLLFFYQNLECVMFFGYRELNVDRRQRDFEILQVI